VAPVDAEADRGADPGPGAEADRGADPGPGADPDPGTDPAPDASGDGTNGFTGAGVLAGGVGGTGAEAGGGESPSTPIRTRGSATEPSEVTEPPEDADPSEDDEPPENHDPSEPAASTERPAEVAVDSSATGSVKLVTAPETIGAPIVTRATAPATSSRGTTRVRRSSRAHRTNAAVMREESGGPAGMWCTKADPSPGARSRVVTLAGLAVCGA
jgi:hypothetical protein